MQCWSSLGDAVLNLILGFNIDYRQLASLALVSHASLRVVCHYLGVDRNALAGAIADRAPLIAVLPVLTARYHQAPSSGMRLVLTHLLIRLWQRWCGRTCWGHFS